MKVLLVTFSDNSDHQDTLFGLYEQLSHIHNTFLLAINKPKVSLIRSSNTWLVDCPERPGICKKTFNFFLLFKIIKKIKKEKFDVIYFESLHIWNLPIMLFCKSTKYQVIHEVIPHEGDKQVKMVDLMNKSVCKLSDYIVLRNRTYMQEMVKRYHIEPERVKYLELWRRYPKYNKPKHTGKILFFGRINPYKGADNLLEIVKMCPNVHFDVIGRVEPQVQPIVDNLANFDNVHLNNEYVSDDKMREVFINADWIIIPYNSASQSGIIIDAYKYSRPVIAFDVGAIHEQIENNKSGFLIEKGNNKEFAAMIKNVLEFSTEKYEEFSENAYAYGNLKYGISGAVSRFCELIEG